MFEPMKIPKAEILKSETFPPIAYKSYNDLEATAVVRRAFKIFW